MSPEDTSAILDMRASIDRRDRAMEAEDFCIFHRRCWYYQEEFSLSECKFCYQQRGEHTLCPPTRKPASSAEFAISEMHNRADPLHAGSADGTIHASRGRRKQPKPLRNSCDDDPHSNIIVISTSIYAFRDCHYFAHCINKVMMEILLYDL